MVPPVNVLAVATAVPPHKLEQRAVADAARQVYARAFARYPKLADVFVNAGIERRYSARSLEWLTSAKVIRRITRIEPPRHPSLQIASRRWTARYLQRFRVRDLRRRRSPPRESLTREPVF